jgi:hypothetical protein
MVAIVLRIDGWIKIVTTTIEAVERGVHREPISPKLNFMVEPNLTEKTYKTMEFYRTEETRSGMVIFEAK